MAKKPSARTAHLGPQRSIGVEFRYVPRPEDVLRRVRTVWPMVALSELVCDPPHLNTEACFQEASELHVVRVCVSQEYFDRYRDLFPEEV